MKDSDICMSSDCIPDLMHVGCLGVTPSTCGVVTWELFKQLGGAISNPKPACARILSMLNSAARELDIPPPVHMLVLGLFRPNTKKNLR